MSQMCRPLSKELRLLGLLEIRRLLLLTHGRNNQGYTGLADYVDEYGGASRNCVSTLNAAVDGNVKSEFNGITVEKLAKMIYIPGKDEYYGDTPEGLSLFMAIYQGWVDGIPPHLSHLKSKQDRNYESMTIDDLEAECIKINAIIKEKSIDLDGINPKHTILAAFLDIQCDRQGITRLHLAKKTIGVALFAQLIDATESISEDAIAPLADAIGVPANVLLILRDSDRVDKTCTNVPQ